MEQQAKEDLEQARLNHETVVNEKAKTGKVYNPYDLETGQKQDAETVFKLLADNFEKIHNATMGFLIGVSIVSIKRNAL